jgi:predicted  nucleic acid-binding Zn-ribbon protein
MVELDLHIKNIQEKLQLLLKQQQLLQNENDKLKKELEKVNQLNSEKEQTLQALHHQMDALKLGSGNLDAAEKAALGKRIDAYLKEIDKCLALLNT